MGNKSCSRIVAPTAFALRGEKIFPKPTLSHAHARHIFICPPNQKLGDAADRYRTQGYSPNPAFCDTIPCASCPSTMHGSAIAILWLHYPACAEILPAPSYDGASSTILCQDTASDTDAPKPRLCSVHLPSCFFTALITGLHAFNTFVFANTTYHLDTTYRPSLTISTIRINPT